LPVLRGLGARGSVETSHNVDMSGNVDISNVTGSDQVDEQADESMDRLRMQPTWVNSSDNVLLEKTSPRYPSSGSLC